MAKHFLLLAAAALLYTPSIVEATTYSLVGTCSGLSAFTYINNVSSGYIETSGYPSSYSRPTFTNCMLQYQVSVPPQYRICANFSSPMTIGACDGIYLYIGASYTNYFYATCCGSTSTPYYGTNNQSLAGSYFNLYWSVGSTPCPSATGWQLYWYSCPNNICPPDPTGTYTDYWGNTTATTYGYNTPFNSYTFTCSNGWAIPPPIDSQSYAGYMCSQAGVWNFQWYSCQPTCAVPSAPTNGAVTVVGNTSTPLSGTYFNGSIATFSCNAGYQLSSAGALTCLGTGQWSSSFPTCVVTTSTSTTTTNTGTTTTTTTTNTGTTSTSTTTTTTTTALVCSSNFFDNTGNVVAAPYTPLSSYTFYCSANRAVEPPVNALNVTYTCQQNGTWSTAFNTCTITCPAAPAPPAAGSVALVGTVSSVLGGLYFSGSTATYTCPAGTAPTSSPVISCLSNGAWSGGAPGCEMQCQQSLCAANGYITDALGNVINPALTKFFAGASYTLTCNAGSTTAAGASSTVYTCGAANLVWSPAVSCCNVYCQNFAITNGYVNMYTMPSLTSGTAAYWTCNSGYLPSGNDPVICSDAGQWFYEMEPACTNILISLEAAASALPSFNAALVGGLQSGETMAAFQPNSPDIVALSAIIADALPYILAALTPTQNKQLGYTLPDVLIDCAFAGEICKSSDIEFAQVDPQLGNCYTFNHQNMGVPYVEVRPGEEQGVYLALSVRQDEYLDFVPSAGMRVIFHDPVAQLIPEVMGDNIAPGYLTQMRIYITTTNRIKTPVSACVSSPSDLAPSTPFYYNGSYSSEACLRSIVQASIVATCGCASPMYALPPGVQSCQLAQLSCVTNFTNSGKLQAVADQVTSDECPDLCSEIIYDVSRAFSVLSNTGAHPYCQVAAHSNMSCEEFTQSDLTLLRAFYDQLYHLTYTEFLAVTPSQLVSAFGGLMGIFFGMSVISCVEFTFCLCEISMVVYKKLCGRVIRVPTLPTADVEKKQRKNILMSDIHALRRVGTVKSDWWVRLFWLACMIASLGLLLTELVNVVKAYEDYQTDVDITVTEGPLRFPAMTFCDLNPYKKSLLSHIGPAQALMNELSSSQQPLGR